MEPSSLKSKILKVFVVLDLVAVNAGVGYAIYSNFKFEILNFKSSSNSQNSNFKTEFVDECGEKCRKYIDERLEIPSVTAIPTTKPVSVKASTSKKVRKEEVLTIPGKGSSQENDWTNLTGTEFYFDTRDYPGLVEVYFEANIKLFNGNGTAYARLFDVTNGIGVTGSENDTSSQSDVWTKSQKVYFWSGRNLIRVQAKSLTADTAVYNQGRLRIVTEN